MVENSLFNQPLMNKYLKKYKKELKLTHKKKEAVLKWIKKLENGELKDEVSNYGLFSRLILETILDYDYEENIEENVKEDYGRGFSEFAIKKDGKKFMVIELKGSETDLDKPQQRKNDKRTPVDQAFDYAKRSGDINWILVSNYDEFRLYNWHKKQHQYISFKAEELKDPETFKSFMLVLSKFSTIKHNLIEKLLSKTIFVERDLEAEFYKLFNETRLMLIAELEHIHPEFTRDESVHYAQLILNRYIFICFAEDLGLLPGEISVGTIETPIKNENLGRSEIWHRLNGLFLDVNEGSDLKKEKIYGYNGGLFKEDLEFLKIRDVIDDHSIFKDAYQKWKFEEYSLIVEQKLGSYSGRINPIYKNLMTISTFNFSSEVDVNILGHIFENSIGEIEELKADKKGRRKKDGIFYTPEYITDYICRNTIIPYLSKSGKSNTVKDLMGEYWGSEIEDLYEKVKNIKIVDPACGSGAFLNKASDILLEIHEAIHKRQYKNDRTLDPFFDNIKERRIILLNNIYGVDLNEESVEITKLSLFLKVSREGLKLPNLDNNIKCGNSLIEKEEYSKNSFVWEKEFNEIFNEGGFDIVIGNPPYLSFQISSEKEKEYIKENYQTAYRNYDIYVIFTEKAINLLKQSGEFGYIIPNKFILSQYGKKLREILNDFYIRELIDFDDTQIFASAKNYTCILLVKKEKTTSNTNYLERIIEPQKALSEYSKNKGKGINYRFLEIERENMTQWRLISKEESLIFSKLDRFDKFINISKNIYEGARPGYEQGYIVSSDLIDNFHLENEILRPFIKSEDIDAFLIDWKGVSNDPKYVIFPYKEIESGFELLEINDYPNTKNYLQRYKDELYDNSDKGGDELRYRYYHLPKELKEDIKIVTPDIAKENEFAIIKDPKILFPNTIYAIDLSDHIKANKYELLGILNSKLIEFYIKIISPKVRGGYHRYKSEYLEQLPMTNLNVLSPLFKELILNVINKKEEEAEEIRSFITWIEREWEVKIDDLKRKSYLKNYWNYAFSEDNKSILNIAKYNKRKIKNDVSSRDFQENLEKEWDNSVAKLNQLKTQREDLETEINAIVFKYYNLTEKEVNIILDSVNVRKNIKIDIINKFREL